MSANPQISQAVPLRIVDRLNGVTVSRFLSTKTAPRMSRERRQSVSAAVELAATHSTESPTADTDKSPAPSTP